MNDANLKGLVLIIIAVLISIFVNNTPGLAKRCVGANPCEACTTCNYCKFCAVENGHCGICQADSLQKPPVRTNKRVQGTIIKK